MSSNDNLKIFKQIIKLLTAVAISPNIDNAVEKIPLYHTGCCTLICIVTGWNFHGIFNYAFNRDRPATILNCVFMFYFTVEMLNLTLHTIMFYKTYRRHRLVVINIFATNSYLIDRFNIRMKMGKNVTQSAFLFVQIMIAILLKMDGYFGQYKHDKSMMGLEYARGELYRNLFLLFAIGLNNTKFIYFILLVNVFNEFLTGIWLKIRKILLKLRTVRDTDDRIVLVNSLNDLLLLNSCILRTMVNVLNEIFNFDLMLIIVNAIVFLVFYAISVGVWLDTHRPTTKLFLMSFFVLFYFFFKFWAITRSVHTAINIVEEYKRLMGKFRIRQYDIYWNYVMTMLNLRLLHMDIQFTIFDLFPVDMRLFYGLFTTCITYLLIMLQFRLLENSK